VEVDILNGEPQIIDMDSTKEDDPKEDDPKGDPKEDENLNNGNLVEKMDVDGKIQDAHTPGNGSGSGDASPTDQQGAPKGAAQLEELGASTNKPNNKPMVLLSPTGSIGAWKASMLPSQSDSGIPSMNINNGTAASVRTSKRIASSVDLDSTEKAAKMKAKKNLESTLDKGKFQQPPSFIFRDDSSLFNSTKSLGIALGNTDRDVFNSLKSLKDIEYNRIIEAKMREDNFVLVEEASTVCSNEDSVDLEALNLVCADIAEGLGDGGCDPLILHTPISQKNKRSPKHKSKIKISSSRRKVFSGIVMVLLMLKSTDFCQT
jgi:hypothetical protein